MKISPQKLEKINTFKDELEECYRFLEIIPNMKIFPVRSIQTNGDWIDIPQEINDKLHDILIKYYDEQIEKLSNDLAHVIDLPVR